VRKRRPLILDLLVEVLFAAVAAALSVQTVDADLVAIVRGGGEGISVLSDPK
jgi:hypothetical protein